MINNEFIGYNSSKQCNDTNVNEDEQLNENRFIDINIDSENETTHAPVVSQHVNAHVLDNINYNVNSSSHTTSNQLSHHNHNKFLFNFKKNNKKSSTRKANQLNDSSKLSSNHVTLTSISNNKTLTLNEAADILLSNLNEIGLNGYDDDDDDEDDEGCEDTEQDLTDINNNINENKISKSKSFYDSKLLNELKMFEEHKKSRSKDKILNSTLMSTTNHQQHENRFYDENSKHNHSTPLASNTLALDNSCLSDISLSETAKYSEVFNENINANNQTLSNSNSFYDNLSNKKDIINDNICIKPPLAHRHSLFNNSRGGTNNKIALRPTSSLNYNFRSDSLVEGLLGDIYDRFNISFKENLDSDVFTEMSFSSSRFSGADSTADHDCESRYYSKYHKLAKSTLQGYSLVELRNLVNEMSTEINQASVKLIRHLKQKDKFISKLNRNCDVITALLQARSLKRRVDTQMKFTLSPMPGEAGFIQWKDAMKALARLPGGVPKEFRKSIWLNLSQKYIKDINLDWNKVRRIAFNDRSNPDDDELGIQIVKDLHRTGCSAFSGQDNDQDRALLKRVLLAFARYNKTVGYCQGFNIIAALILEIVDKKAEDAFMCMIYLIDHILPEGYFTNSMHTLAIDMAVFRELLKIKLPKLCQHLNNLQYNSLPPQSSSKSSIFSSRKNKSTSQLPPTNTYEPPLTNVFTMQWFLTLFATCLPKNVILRVWDCIFLEGSEILFRTSIAIWDQLSSSVIKANSADAFYSMMSVLSIKLFDQNVIDENELINKIYSYGSFPLAGLEELREKFTFNITPFQMCLQSMEGDKSKSSKSNKEGLSNLKLTNKASSISSSTSSLNDIINLPSSISSPSMSRNSTNDTTPDLALRKFDDDKLNDDDDEAEDLAKIISCFALLMPNRPAITSNESSNPSAYSNQSAQSDIMMTAAAAASAFGLNNSSQAFSMLNKKLKNNESNKNPQKEKSKTENGALNNNHDISTLTPGAFSFMSQMYNPKPLSEHMTLDLNELKNQYKKLKERQRQAHIIIQAASAHHRLKATASTSANTSAIASNLSLNRNSNVNLNNNHQINSPFVLEKPPIINHLLIKSNDPNCNTVKKSIQLSTSNPLVPDYKVPSSPNDSINKERMNANRSIINKIFNEPQVKETKRKVSKPYYSDDEEDDDDDDDDDDDEDEEDDEEASKLNDNTKDSKKQSIEVLNSKTSYKDDNFEENLIDLKQFQNDPKTDSISCSSSSSVSSPGPNKKETSSNQVKEDDLLKFNSTEIACSSSSSLVLQSSVESAVSITKTSSSKTILPTEHVKSRHSSKHISSSTIINNLANEEKRLNAIVNPFPVRQINSIVAKNGLRLGLYK